MDYKKQGNYTKISIEDIEEFFILTDDIVRIIRYHKAFYDDEGRQRYFENAKEYQNAMSHEDNFIVEKLICSDKYVNGGLLNSSAEEIFEENLKPLQRLILALYRNGTGGDCFYQADESFSDKYLLKAVTLRIIDRMLCEAESRQPNNYFLTWAVDGCHDENVWVGIVSTKEALERLYKKIKEEDGAYYEEEGFKLEAYKCAGEYEFVPVNIM